MFDNTIVYDITDIQIETRVMNFFSTTMGRVFLLFFLLFSQKNWDMYGGSNATLTKGEGDF